MWEYLVILQDAGLRPVEHAGHLRQHPLGPALELDAIRREGDAVIGAGEQRGPGALLQVPDDFAQVGLGDEQSLGRPVDGAHLSNGIEILQML